MRPIQFSTAAYSGAAATSIALSQTPLDAGNLTINGALASGGVATLSPAGFITITTNANESAKTVTVYGTTVEGWTVTLGPFALASSATTTTYSLISWATITRIAVSAATSAALTVGTAQAGASAWRPLDIYTPSPQTAISTDITGTVNYTWEYTNDDPFDTGIPHIPVDHPTSALVGASADQTGQATAVMRAVRIKINSGSGTTRNTITQQSTQ